METQPRGVKVLDFIEIVLFEHFIITIVRGRRMKSIKFEWRKNRYRYPKKEDT